MVLVFRFQSGNVMVKFMNMHLLVVGALVGGVALVKPGSSPLRDDDSEDYEPSKVQIIESKKKSMSRRELQKKPHVLAAESKKHAPSEDASEKKASENELLKKVGAIEGHEKQSSNLVHHEKEKKKKLAHNKKIREALEHKKVEKDHSKHLKKSSDKKNEKKATLMKQPHGPVDMKKKAKIAKKKKKAYVCEGMKALNVTDCSAHCNVEALSKKDMCLWAPCDSSEGAQKGTETSITSKCLGLNEALMDWQTNKDDDSAAAAGANAITAASTNTTTEPNPCPNYHKFGGLTGAPTESFSYGPPTYCKSSR